jgi:predicted phosphodiesterase
VRYLVLSDVHGDLAALEAVLADAGPVDEVLFLGDALDFGPEPDACIARLRAVADRWVRGNHDEAVGHGQPGDGWSPSLLSAESRAFLADLPERVVVDGATLRHSFRSNILPPEPRDFDAFATPLCLVGHTHVPFLYLRGPDGDRAVIEPKPDQPIDVRGLRAIANPGSVGLSFVAQNVASYLIYEPTERATFLTWRAVPRSAAAVVARLRANGAPPELQTSSQLYVDGGLSFMVDTAAAHRAWAATAR